MDRIPEVPRSINWFHEGHGCKLLVHYAITDIATDIDSVEELKYSKGYTIIRKYMYTVVHMERKELNETYLFKLIFLFAVVVNICKI